jgi:CdiI N-terminal domain
VPEFNIRFIGEEVVDEGVRLAHLTLTLGSFTEGMFADLTTWSKADYEKQWQSEITSILTSQEKTALITSIHDPNEPYRIQTWPMWRKADVVYFQSRLLFMLELGTEFKPSLVREHIGEHQRVSEDGDQLSEWSIPLSLLKAFVGTGAEV